MYTAFNGVISNGLLRIKAMDAKREFEAQGKGHLVGGFKVSVGWFIRFCRRHGVTSRQGKGEAADADRASIEQARGLIPPIIARLGVSLDDIYNMDKTGLWFLVGPSRTCTREKRQKGIKKHSQIVTLAICCNATGTHKMLRILLGKSKNPRCFAGRFRPEHYVMYRAQRSSWMVISIFDEFVVGLNMQGRMKGKQLVLLVNNAPCHAMLPEHMVEEWP